MGEYFVKPASDSNLQPSHRAETAAKHRNVRAQPACRQSPARIRNGEKDAFTFSFFNSLAVGKGEYKMSFFLRPL